MARWKTKMKLRHLLTEETDASAIMALCNGVLSACEKTDAPLTMFRKALRMADEDAETALLVVNDAMDRLYDWADANRVWIE